MDSTIRIPEGRARVVDRSDVVVVGGGPAGIAAAVSAAQRRERHAPRALSLCWRPRRGRHGPCPRPHGERARNHRAGDLHRNDRAHVQNHLCVTPDDTIVSPTGATCRKAGGGWARRGRSISTRRPRHTRSRYAAAFDPDAFKQAAYDLFAEARVKLRTHSWFSSAIVEDGADQGCRLPDEGGTSRPHSGPCGDRRHGRPRRRGGRRRLPCRGQFHPDHRFAWGGVDTDAAERFEFEEPARFKTLDHEAKRLSAALGVLVAQDAASGRRLAELPAYSEAFGPQSGGPDEGRIRRPRPDGAPVDFAPGEIAGLREGLCGRFRAADGRPPDRACCRANTW